MKKLLLYTLSLLLCSISVAQEVPLFPESINRSINENDDFLRVQRYDMVWKYSESDWEHTRNVTYTYDNFNNPIEKFESWTDGSGPHSKTSCFYDANHNLDEERLYDYSGSAWINSAKNQYNYDGNNNRIQKVRQVWDDDQFENASKSTYAYDANNKKIYQMMYYWDEGAWHESQKFDYQYDENNNLYTILSEVLEENEWIKHQKSVFTYDTINNLLNVLSSNWDPETSNWAHPHMQQNYTYDEDNNRIIFVIQTWYEYDEVWTNLYKSTYYYVPTGSESVENQNSDLNKAIEDFQTTEDDIIIDPVRDDKILIGVEVLIDSVLHTSDGDLEFTLSHNDISENIIYQAGGDGDNFISTKLSDNGADTLANGIAPFYGIYKPENPLSAFLETNPSGTWTLSIYDGAVGNSGTLQSWGLNLIYSSSSAVGDALLNKTEIVVFPNPASDKISLQSAVFSRESTTVVLFDLNGRKLIEKQILQGSEEITVDVNRLQSGVYFCRVTVDNKSVTKKLIIQK